MVELAATNMFFIVDIMKRGGVGGGLGETLLVSSSGWETQGERERERDWVRGFSGSIPQ